MKLEDSTAEVVTASAQDALRITVNAMKYAIMNNVFFCLHSILELMKISFFTFVVCMFGIYIFQFQ